LIVLQRLGGGGCWRGCHLTLGATWLEGGGGGFFSGTWMTCGGD